MKKKRISTQSGKAKGRNLQKKVVQKILEQFNELTERDVRSTSMGASGADVQLSELGSEVFPYAVECKKLATFAIYKHWEQANNNKGTLSPLLVIEGDRKPALAIVDLDHFMELVNERK